MNRDLALLHDYQVFVLITFSDSSSLNFHLLRFVVGSIANKIVAIIYE